MAQKDDSKAAYLQEELRRIDARRVEIEAELADLEMLPKHRSELSGRKKVAIFRRLFAGRPDVFALRWENVKDGRSGYAPACASEWVAGVCGKPKIKCGACPNQAFLPVTDDAVVRHLRGSQNGRADYVMGVYALLPDDRCWFLAADFDGEDWADDARAFLTTCRANAVPAALERSRSGNGGHVWIFFSEPVPAREARQLGSALMTEAMERRPEIKFSSYDRFFPSQDVMPAGGFGNLIALPLARRSRDRGNSVFVDDALNPYEDQWAFLSGLSQLSATELSRLVSRAQESGRVLGVRMPVDDDDAPDPWLLPPSRRVAPRPITGALPKSVRLVLADGVYVDRTGLPPELTARLIRLAAFQNPEFYRAQALRLPTYGKPRIVSCAELDSKHVVLPRGGLDEAVSLLRSNGIRANIEDCRESGAHVELNFLGTLKPEQSLALEAVIEHECGVLAAGTAFGKTVVAAAAIAKRGRSTLVLVHRQELLAQWRERLKTFLSIDASEIGTIGGGRRKPTGRIDVALMQSLVRKGVVSDAIEGYGHLIVDECHHISAATFEQIARRSKARFVLGLSATVSRKDGHHPIIFMQCGPVRYRVDLRTQAAQRGFAHLVKERRTGFDLPPELQNVSPTMPSIFAALAKDVQRNRLIVDDVLEALERKRNPLVLTERRDHLEYLAECFKGAAKNITVLRGGMSAKQRRAAESSRSAPEKEERLILATGKYLGEGFDDARLDTLFIAMPIAWKGTLAQYVGRLHREHPGKREVVVYDYVDAEVPVLARMAAKRQAGYRALGYRFDVSGSTQTPSAPRFDTPEENDVDTDLRPSTVADGYWIYAERQDADAYPAHGARGGKWMLFIKTSEIDEWWVKIKAATEAGLLGGGSKVATAKENPNAASRDTRVICVYTYDVADEADCTRVRQALRELGVTWRIPYKSDVDTIAGRYSKEGVRVSRRYE